MAASDGEGKIIVAAWKKMSRKAKEMRKIPLFFDIFIFFPRLDIVRAYKFLLYAARLMP